MKKLLLLALCFLSLSAYARSNREMMDDSQLYRLGYIIGVFDGLYLGNIYIWNKQKDITAGTFENMYLKFIGENPQFGDDNPSLTMAGILEAEGYLIPKSKSK